MSQRQATPVISVCIANYNGEAMLVDCIDSILRQSVDIPVEIIIHDDASTDGSVRLIRDRYPRVVLIESAANVGFCVANNRMVRQARGEFILLLNNDAALFDDALDTLLRYARSQAGPAILSLPQYDWETGALVDRGCRLDLAYYPVPIRASAPVTAAFVIGACMWLPRSLWMETGGFPEWMGSIGEDLYLCAVARLRGVSVFVPDASGYRHRQGVSFGGNKLQSGRLRTTIQRRYLSERNRSYVLFIATPTVLVWPWLLLHAGLILAEGLVLSVLRLNIRILGQVHMKALIDLIREMPRLIACRRQVQRSRVVSLRAYLRPFVCTLQKLRLLARHGVPEIGTGQRT
ncbi:glycosyltransferase [Fontimonas sp. SYSU GA230001]|uniref:glycosyltransferase family 2 protein n=1 Tax=Fontimonas sp. SYSU GA230001 TaxID=3142450 RepID=UPI0032B478F5